MKEQVPVVDPAAAESAAGSSSASLLSATDSGEQAPTHQNKTPPKKRNAVPQVRNVVKDILRDEPKIAEVNADFFVSLGRMLRTVERDNRARRLSLSIV